MCLKKICVECKEQVVSSDFGYYCVNQNCEAYDKDILAFEEVETVEKNELDKED